MNKENKLLTAVVPVSSMAGNLQYLNDWLHRVKSTQLSVIIVHDKRDEETSGELKKIIKHINSSDIQFFEGIFDGPGGARNFGLQHVTTRWVSFWDSDDMPYVDTILSAINVAHPATQVITHNFEVLNIQTEKLSQSKTPLDLVDLGCQGGIWRYSFRTTLAIQSRFGIHRMGEDQIFLAQLPDFAKSIEIINNISYRYIKGHTSHLTENSARYEWLESSLSDLIEAESKFKSRNILALTIAIRLSLTLIKSGKIKHAIHGVKFLVLTFAKSDFDLIHNFNLMIRVAIKAVTNA